MGFVSDPQQQPQMGGHWFVISGDVIETDMPTWLEIDGRPHQPYALDRQTHTGRWVRVQAGALDADGVHLAELVVPGCYRVTADGATVAAWG